MKDPKPHPIHYGPNNPHPLSQLKTELVWEGKYDEYGRRREVDVAALAMPMQKIETIDQPRSEAAAKGQMAMFEKTTKRLDDFRNMLIWGDNKLVMASLLRNFKGKIDLIYIDPPFDVGADFTMDVPLGGERDEAEKNQSALEMVAYRDTWGKGTDSYIYMMCERLGLARELLSDEGYLFVHCDWRVNFLLRAVADEIFGKENFLNHIIWSYRRWPSTSRNWQSMHDDILFYAKKAESSARPFAVEYEEPSESYVRRFKGKTQVLDEETRTRKITVDAPTKGLPMRDVWELSIVAGFKAERTEYATQKPESLVDRIIRSCTAPESIVADFFCGSGTTGAVAERLGRRWIMCDLGRFAIHTSRKRLIGLQRELHEAGKPYRAFDVYNLGRYERQWWQKDALKGADEEHRRVVLEFFRAEVLTNSPSPLIHGRKSGAFCHVDGIDSMFSRGEAREVARAVAEAGGKECYVLAWEFEMDLRLTTAALEQEFGVHLKLIQIPREIMEKNRKNPPPFLEMAVLEAAPVVRKEPDGVRVDIKLVKFMPSLAEVPSKELDALKERAIRSGLDFIDFWAIDFDWKPGMPFNHHWQDYRTRKDRSLKTVSDAGYWYPKAGKYTACVKVVDVFGSDTSITVEVRV